MSAVMLKSICFIDALRRLLGRKYIKAKTVLRKNDDHLRFPEFTIKNAIGGTRGTFGEPAFLSAKSHKSIILWIF